MAVTPEQLAANLRSAENLARSRAGLPSSANLPDSGFTYDQRIAFNKEMAKILAQYPDRFNAQSAVSAANVTAKTYEALQTQSLGDSAGIFVNEAGNQLVKLHATLNPLSEENRQNTASTLKWTVILLGVGAAAIYFGPALFKGGQALKSKTAKVST